MSITKYSNKATAAYLMLEALIYEAIVKNGNKNMLNKRIVESLNSIATEIVVLIGLLSLTDAYIAQNGSKE